MPRKPIIRLSLARRLVLPTLTAASGLALGWHWRSYSAANASKSSPLPPVAALDSASKVSPASHSDASGRLSLTLSETGLLKNLDSLRKWAANAPEEALAWLGRDGSSATPEQRLAVMTGLLDCGMKEAAMAVIEDMPEPALRHVFRESMMMALAENDPATSFNYGVQFSLFRSASVIRSLFCQWAARDPEAATLAWSRLPNVAQRFEALASVAASLGQLDPEAALSWSNDLPPGPERELAVELVWAGWSKKDPHAVLEKGRVLEAPLGRSVMQTAIAELTRRDPEEARRMATEEADPLLRDAMLFAMGEEIAAANPEIAAQLSSAIQVGTEESTLTMSTMRAWLLGDAESAISWANELPDNRRSDALHVAFFQLADADPKTAAEMLARANAPTALGEQIAMIGRGWAEHDPEMAAAWAEKLPPHRQLDAMKGVIAGAARENPGRALEMLDKQPENCRAELVQSLASGWAHQDPAAALDWASGLKGGERTRATGKVVELLARVDPLTAAEAVETWLKESAGEPPSGLPEGYTHPMSLAVTEITRNWNPERYDEAVSWTASLPDGALRTEATATIFQQWARSSPTRLADHLQTMPAGAARDEGGYQLAITLARADIGAAAAWASSLSSPQARESAARFFIEAARDKSQAYEHIITAGLLGAEETHALFK